MAGPWEKFKPASEPEGPWTKYQKAASKSEQPQEEKVGTVEDIGRSSAAGLRRGVESIVGLMGDVGELGSAAGTWVARNVLGASEEGIAKARELARTNVPTTADIHRATSSVIGESYQPKTTAGKYARTIGEFAPAAALGPGSAVRKAAMATIPAVSSEAAGQMTEGTAAEPYARVAGAIVGTAPAALLTPSRNIGGVVGRAAQGTTSRELDAAEALFQEAQRRGVPITRFEAMQQVTGGATRSGDVQRVIEGQGGLRDFMAARPRQIEASARQQMDDIAQIPQAQFPAGPSTIGPALGRSAEDVVTDVRQSINQATEPLYQTAAPRRVSPQVFQRVQAAPGWQEARDAIRNDPQLARYVQNLPDDSVGFLNEVYKYLNQQADNAAGSMNAQQNMQRSAGYGADATAVRQAAENASPEFAQAVQEQARLRQQYLDPLLQGPLGKIAGRDTATQDAINALFPRNPLPNSAQEIGRTIGVLSSRNPVAARQLVRAHVESTFNQATRDLQAGANQWGGAGFVASLRGNPQQAANLEAAIRALPQGDEVWQGFDRYLSILEATGQRQRIGSQTAFNVELQQDLRAGSPLGTASSIAAGAGLSWPKKALDMAERWRMGRNVDQIARLITDPEASRAFRSLATAEGKKLGNIALSITMMGRAGSVGGDKGVNQRGSNARAE